MTHSILSITVWQLEDNDGKIVVNMLCWQFFSLATDADKSVHKTHMTFFKDSWPDPSKPTPQDQPLSF